MTEAKQLQAEREAHTVTCGLLNNLRRDYAALQHTLQCIYECWDGNEHHTAKSDAVRHILNEIDEVLEGNYP